MTLRQKRRKAADKCLQRAKRMEYAKIKSGKWNTQKEYVNSMGGICEVWSKRCWWYCEGRMSGFFAVMFHKENSKPIGWSIID